MRPFEKSRGQDFRENGGGFAEVGPLNGIEPGTEDGRRPAAARDPRRERRGPSPRVPRVGPGPDVPHLPRRLSPPADTDGRRRCVSQFHRVRSRTRIKFRIRAGARAQAPSVRPSSSAPRSSHRVPLSREGFSDRHHHRPHRHVRARAPSPGVCPSTGVSPSAGCHRERRICPSSAPCRSNRPPRRENTRDSRARVRIPEIPSRVTESERSEIRNI